MLYNTTAVSRQCPACVCVCWLPLSPRRLVLGQGWRSIRRSKKAVNWRLSGRLECLRLDQLTETLCIATKYNQSLAYRNLSPALHFAKHAPIFSFWRQRPSVSALYVPSKYVKLGRSCKRAREPWTSLCCQSVIFHARGNESQKGEITV